MSSRTPVLWHIPVSHYNEKARWALDYKGVEHERRAPMPGAHMAIAGWLTCGRSKTFPLLVLDGRAIGDSTAIIAAIEERFPDPPLYPGDPDERRRALELEDYFDENLGAQIRLLVFHEIRRDQRLMADLTAEMIPGPVAKLPGARSFGGAFGSAYTQLRYRVASDESAADARAAVLATLDRLDAELGASGGEYLVGDSFSVADLTAAALFYPMVNPPEGPNVIDGLPPALEEFFAPLRSRPGYEYVRRMYRDHRKGAVARQVQNGGLS
jgi:glutathione S-transferase